MSTSRAADLIRPRTPYTVHAGLWPLALAILVGIALRIYRLGTNSLWFDEFATLSLASQSAANIIHTTSSANYIPPLYFLVVHGVLQLFGESEITLRLFSVLAGIGTIPVIWLLVDDVARSRGAANVAALLLAVNPLHIWYSQEARPYTLLLFFGCCALLALERAVRKESLPYWLAFSACSALAFLTHTTGVMFVLIAFAWVLLLPDRKRVLQPFLLASLGAGLACAPAVFVIARAFVEAEGAFHSAPRSLTGLEVPYTLFTFLGGYSFGPAPREIQNLGALAALRNHFFQSALVGAALCGVIVFWWSKRRPGMMGFIMLLLIPLGTIFVLSLLTGKAYNVRYTLPSLVGFLGVTSIATWALAPRPRALLLTVLIGLALWADGQWFWSSRYWKEDSRAAVAWLRDKLPSGARVAVAPNYCVLPLTYYSRKASADLRFLPLPRGAGMPEDTSPDALVLTRLHHVPNWRELKTDFEDATHAQVLLGKVPGYEMMVGRRSDLEPQRRSDGSSPQH